MFNPCYPFTPELLEAMLAKNVKYFVRSSYKRGRDYPGETKKEAFILSHYQTLEEAQHHFKNILADPYRFFYNANNLQHLERLHKAAVTKDYKVYSQLIVPGSEDKVTRRYAKQTSLYLFKNTNWKLKRGTAVSPGLFMQEGELYARIACQGNEITVKFEDIENTK